MVSLAVVVINISFLSTFVPDLCVRSLISQKDLRGDSLRIYLLGSTMYVPRYDQLRCFVT